MFGEYGDLAADFSSSSPDTGRSTFLCPPSLIYVESPRRLSIDAKTVACLRLWRYVPHKDIYGYQQSPLKLINGIY
jgi:hypothetical protein